MEHVVFWSSPSGPAFERVPALAEAVDLVQRLRNDQGVTDAEVHALTAVPLSFRTVVVVEPASGSGTSTLPDLPPAPRLQAAPGPIDEYGEALAPLGGAVPGVVPDPVGPFKSLAAVSSHAAESLGEDEIGVPHLVGLPSVGPERVELEETGPETGEAAAEDEYAPMLHALAEAAASAGDGDSLTEAPTEAGVPEQATGYELPVEPPVRSLGLFA